MIINDYGFDNPQNRKETLELIKEIVNDNKNNLKLELTVKAFSMLGTLVEKQEQIIEDLEERVAIMSESAEETENKLRTMFNRCICFRGSLNCCECTMRNRCEKERTFYKGYSLVNGKRVNEEGGTDG